MAVAEVDQAYRAREYSELSSYRINLPPEPLSLGLDGLARTQALLETMLNRLEGMVEEGQRQLGIDEATYKLLDQCYKDTLALIIFEGVKDREGRIIIDKADLLKMRSAYMQEAAALQNPDFLSLSSKRKQAQVTQALAKNYLETVKLRYQRLSSTGYALNTFKEILLSNPGAFATLRTASFTDTAKPTIPQTVREQYNDLNIPIVDESTIVNTGE